MEGLSASDVVYCGTGSQIHQRNVVRIYRKFCLLLPMLLSVGHPSFTSCLSSTMAGHAFLSTILLLPILSYCAFRMLFKYLDYRVRHTWHLILLRFTVKPLGLCWRTGRHRTVSAQWANTSKTDKTFGEQHGCQPPNRLLNEFPLGLDRLHQIFSADANNRLMALFMYHFRLWGDTLEQVFLGTRALGTIDPRNLEAMLSTQFNGCE